MFRTALQSSAFRSSSTRYLSTVKLPISSDINTRSSKSFSSPFSKPQTETIRQQPFFFKNLRSYSSTMSDSAPTPACCPPGSWPQLMTTSNADLNKDDAPAAKGAIEKVAVDGQDEMPIYVVEPSDTPKGIVLVVPDIYSVRVLHPEVRSGDRIGSICDALADEGYLVGLAGIFRDKPFDLAVSGPDDGDFPKFDCFAADGGVDWFKAQGYEKVGPSLQAAASYLKEKAPDAKVFSAGFCFGTWALCKANSTGDVAMDGIVAFHPTTILENAVFGRDEDAMMKELKCKTIFLWAGNDHPSYTGDGSNKTAVEATGGQVYEFPEQLHGWVSRGDVAVPEVKAGVEKALTIMKDFYASNL